MRRKSSIRMESTFDDRDAVLSDYNFELATSARRTTTGPVETQRGGRRQTQHTRHRPTQGGARAVRGARRGVGARGRATRWALEHARCVRLRVTMLKRVRNVEYEAQRQLNVYSPLAQDQMVLWDEMRTSLSLLWRTPAGSMAWQAHSRSAWCSHPGRLLGRGRS